MYQAQCLWSIKHVCISNFFAFHLFVIMLSLELSGIDISCLFTKISRSSFPVIHKLGNVCISIQLSMEINWKQELNLFQCKFTLVIMLWTIIEATDFSIHLIFKIKQYKNANIVNFVYYRKTRIFTARKRSLGQGNMFTGVCLSIGGSGPGGCLLPGGAWRRPPRTATAVGGMHPIEMHSCYPSFLPSLACKIWSNDGKTIYTVFVLDVHPEFKLPQYFKTQDKNPLEPQATCLTRSLSSFGNSEHGIRVLLSFD